MNKKLIVNADDFGWDAETTEATISAFEAGALTSATIMVGRDGTKLACEYARRFGDRFSFGLHFNIVDGHTPLSKQITSLTARDGTFHISRKQRALAALELIKAEEVSIELSEQLKELGKYGVQPTHIDSHGHLHKIPAIFRGVTKTALEHGIHRIRRSQNAYISKPSIFSKLANRRFSATQCQFISTDTFITLTTYENWAELVAKAVTTGTNELAVHPGTSESWRIEELKPLINGTLLEEIKRHKIDLISYHNI